MPLRGRGNSVIYGGSQIEPEEKEIVDRLLDQLEIVIDGLIVSRKLRRAMVRTTLPCITYVYINSTDIFIAAAANDVMTSTIYLPMNEGIFSAEDVAREVRWEQGLKDPFVFHFDRAVASQDPKSIERITLIASTAQQFVDMEVERFMAENQLMTIKPIFGDTRFRVQENLCFIIMPFRQELTDVFDTVVKPTVEKHGLVARRADDIRGIQPIMSDIWKSICEARIVLADLTDRNANVFYELGIAHTLGKNTVLISQQEEESIPFDISHIRQIRYRDNARGLETLKTELDATLESVLFPDVAS